MTPRKPANPATVYLSKWPKSSDTYTTMLGALKRVAKALNCDDVELVAWGALTYADTRGIAATLAESLARRTINKCLSALRGVLETAWRSGEMPDEEYRRIKIENVRGSSSESSGRALSDNETEKFEAALERATPRDAALLAVLFACGLRRIEVQRMRVEDYDATTGQLRARGKGNKIRSVTVVEDLRPYVTAYWATLGPVGAAFHSSKGDLTRRGVSYIVERFVKNAKLEKFTPHDLRRSFATLLLHRGVPISVVQRLMGHADINTTALYDKSGKDAEIEAVKMLSRLSRRKS